MSPSTLHRRSRWRWTLLLVGACLISYANGLTGDFTYDDKAIVRDNPRIRSPKTFPEILTTGYFGRPKGSGTNYRPVLLTSYAVQWWAHGGRAAPFHAVNLLLHIAVTLMFVRLLLRAGFSEPVSLGAGLLFAVLPIHVEAVTSLVGRGETLAALFVLAFLRLGVPLPTSERISAARYAGAFLSLFLGLLTKESAAVAPLLAFLLLFHASEGGLRVRAVLVFRRGAVLFAGSAAVFAAVLFTRAAVLGGYIRANRTGIFELENPLAPLSHLDRIANASALLVRYLGRSVFPLLLTADESAWSLPVLRVGAPASFLWPLMLIGVTVAAVAAMRRAPAVALGFLFFLASFAVTANVLFPIGTIFAERLAYLPSAGTCLVLAALFAGPFRDWRTMPRARVAALLLLTALFAARTVVRNPAWRDDWTLFANTATTSPRSAKAHYNLAYVLSRQGDRAGALAYYERAVGIFPKYYDAWAGKGRIEKELGRLADAEASYERSIQVQPAYENGFFGLGGVREARGDWKGAEEAYASGLRKVPRSLPLAYRLALVRSKRAPDGADEDWRRAVALGPDVATTRLGYAGYLLERGRPEEAADQARAVLRRAPASAEANALLADLRREEGLRFAEGLAREKVFRATRSGEDLRKLMTVVRESPPYRARFEALRPRLEKLAPRAFRDRAGASG